MNFYSDYFLKISSAICSVEEGLLENCVNLISTRSEQGGKVIIVGNGGSAAIASHVSVDFTKAAGIRAINFNEADMLTCFSNDFGYEHWVEKALDFYADKNDTLILISSSGMSPNILNGARKAKNMGIPLITFSGFQNNNILKDLGDINFWVQSREYNIVEMTHHIWLLSIVDKIIAEKNK